MARGPGLAQQKILLLLLGGLALGVSASPGNLFKLLKEIGREWECINRSALRRAIQSLYQSRLVDVKETPDGTMTLILTDSGKHRALSYKLNEMEIVKPKRWDKKWRVVLFDIPEKRKKTREALRFHLKQLGLRELQKSVFIFPYPCGSEIDFLVEFFELRRHVRQIVATSIDNEPHMKQWFNLA